MNTFDTGTADGIWKAGHVVALPVLLFCSCIELYDERKENLNAAPNTTMANIPMELDTVGALASLFWDGEDYDGFVVAYQYRYTTIATDALLQDSIIHDWVHTEHNTAAISFSSPGEVNRQEFQVRAVDNSGNIDPTPATRVFFTRRTIPPTTTILSPRPNAEFFVTEQTNYWFPGIIVTISGEDRDGNIIEFGWSADGGEWHWVPARDSVVVIRPSDFAPPLTGTHTIHVSSRDNTLLVDSIGFSINVVLVQPTFQNDILILDDTREDVSVRNVADQAIDSFYAEIFGSTGLSVDSRDMRTRAFPSLSILGNYRLVIWHGDDSKIPFYLTNSVAINAIQNYLHVGGDLILCGTRIWDPWLPAPDPVLGLPHPLVFNTGSFVREYLHVNAGELSSFEGTFQGAEGVDGFIDLDVDTSKMNPAYPQFSRPHLVQVVVDKGPFVREILRFSGPDPYAAGLPCAIRYYGDTFDLAFIGFPLWAIEASDARTFARQLLQSMGYQ